MSISLKVVNSAAVCCAWTNLSASRRRNGLIGTSFSWRSPRVAPATNDSELFSGAVSDGGSRSGSDGLASISIAAASLDRAAAFIWFCCGGDSMGPAADSVEAAWASGKSSESDSRALMDCSCLVTLGRRPFGGFSASGDSATRV